jgi:hypothetical protein
MSCGRHRDFLLARDGLILSRRLRHLNWQASPLRAPSDDPRRPPRRPPSASRISIQIYPKGLASDRMINFEFNSLPPLKMQTESCGCRLCALCSLPVQLWTATTRRTRPTYRSRMPSSRMLNSSPGGPPRNRRKRLTPRSQSTQASRHGARARSMYAFLPLPFNS